MTERIDQYHKKIGECRGTYTVQYIDKLLFQKDACEELFKYMIKICEDKYNEDSKK